MSKKEDPNKKKTVKKRPTGTGSLLVKKKVKPDAHSKLTMQSLFLLPFMKNSVCTFLGPYSTPISQLQFECKECEMAVCESCAHCCHDGHTLTKCPETKFMCGCGSKGSHWCKAYEKFERLDKTDFNTTLYVMLKWSRPLTKCSVGADLPRLGHKHEIRNQKGVIVYPTPDQTPDDSNHLAMAQCLLSVFSKQMASEDVSVPFGAHFTDTKVDFGTHANDFMKDLGDDHWVVKLLKASCSQGIVSPAWVKLKLELLEGLPFKDVKLGWKCMCNFVNCIEHVQKKEQGEPPEDSEDFTPPFTFTWELQMIFDRTMKHLRHTSFRITELEIASVDAETEAKIRAVARDWFEESAIPPVGRSPLNPELAPRSLAPLKGSRTGSLTARSRTTSLTSSSGKGYGKPASSPRASVVSATDLALQKLLQTAWDNDSSNVCVPDWLKTQLDDAVSVKSATPNPSANIFGGDDGIESLFLKKALPSKTADTKLDLTSAAENKDEPKQVDENIKAAEPKEDVEKDGKEDEEKGEKRNGENTEKIDKEAIRTMTQSARVSSRQNRKSTRDPAGSPRRHRDEKDEDRRLRHEKYASLRKSVTSEVVIELLAEDSGKKTKEMEAQNKRLKKSNALLQEEVKLKDSANDEIGRKYEELEQKLRESQEREREFGKERGELESKLHFYERINDEMKEKEENLEKVNTELIKKEEDLERVNKELFEKERTLEVVNRELLDKERGLEEVNKRLRVDLEALTKKKQDLEEENKALKEKIKEKEGESKLKDEALRKWEELARKKEEEAKVERECFEDEIKELKKKLREPENENGRLECETSSSERESVHIHVQQAKSTESSSSSSESSEDKKKNDNEQTDPELPKVEETKAEPTSNEGEQATSQCKTADEAGVEAKVESDDTAVTEKKETPTKSSSSSADAEPTTEPAPRESGEATEEETNQNSTEVVGPTEEANTEEKSDAKEDVPKTYDLLEAVDLQASSIEVEDQTKDENKRNENKEGDKEGGPSSSSSFSMSD